MAEKECYSGSNDDTIMLYNNKGFTFIELLVCVAIMAVLSLSLVTFMQFSSKFYFNQSSTTFNQSDVDTMVNEVGNVIRNAAEATIYTSNTSNDIRIVTKDSNDSWNVLCFVFDAEGDGKLYVRYNCDNASANAINKSYLLVENIKMFSVSKLKNNYLSDEPIEPEDEYNKRSVVLSMTVQRKEREFSSQVNVSLRNSRATFKYEKV